MPAAVAEVEAAPVPNPEADSAKVEAAPGLPLAVASDLSPAEGTSAPIPNPEAAAPDTPESAPGPCKARIPDRQKSARHRDTGR